jgi:hypothetical protein
MKKITLAFAGLFSLLLGTLIYVVCRAQSLILFEWLSLLKIDHSNFRTSMELPYFVKYNLPNGLFLIFGYIFMYIIWGRSKYYLLYSTVVTVLSILYELSQIKIINGTFDIMDLTVIIISFVFSIVLYKHCGVNYNKEAKNDNK